MSGKPWTEEEDLYLSEKWGTTSVPGIAKALGRSEKSVLNRKQRIRLGAFLESGDYVTWNQLNKVVNGNAEDSYQQISWIQNRQFPIKYKKVGKCKFRIVYLKDFWNWLYKNVDLVDLSKFEKNSLGEEPEWIEKLRNSDKIIKQHKKVSKWTEQEDNLLKDLLKTKHYTCDQLARRLRRSEGAVIRRISELKIEDKPLRNSPHNEWTASDIETIYKLIEEGHKYTYIAKAIEYRHSEKAIRGFVYRDYKTERLDRIREARRNAG